MASGEAGAVHISPAKPDNTKMASSRCRLEEGVAITGILDVSAERDERGTHPDPIPAFLHADALLCAPIPASDYFSLMHEDQPFLVFGAPSIGEEEITEVEAVLRSGWLGTGPRVARFKQDFATYKGLDASHAAAMNSCTAALHVSMVAAGLDPGTGPILQTASSRLPPVSATSPNFSELRRRPMLNTTTHSPCQTDRTCR